MLPQVGQGALAVECRAGDAAVRRRLAEIDHTPSRLAVEAERAFLREIGEGCELPVGALARITREGAVFLDAMIASLDGHRLLRDRAEGTDPEEVGRRLARRLLDEGGGADLLAVAALESPAP